MLVGNSHNWRKCRDFPWFYHCLMRTGLGQFQQCQDFRAREDFLNLPKDFGCFLLYRVKALKGGFDEDDLPSLPPANLR